MKLEVITPEEYVGPVIGDLNRRRGLPRGQETRMGGAVAIQAEVPLANTQVLQRALQYAATYGYGVWLRPQEFHLGKGVAASGPLATRLGLPGIPVAAETIALHTIFELMRITGARVHL